MILGRLVRGTLSLLLFVVSAMGVIWWFNQITERVVIDISAALDVPEKGLPVYAQFVVTQTLTIPEPTNIAKLNVPVYFPGETGKQLLIEMWQNEALIARWRYSPKQVGRVEVATLSIVPPQGVEGEIVIRFSASDVGHAEVDSAPRLFVETAGHYYKGGNYFIAKNAKTGDVSLSLYAQKTNQEILYELWRRDPLNAISFIFPWVTLFLLIIVLPQVVARGVSKYQNNQKKYNSTPEQ